MEEVVEEAASFLVGVAVGEGASACLHSEAAEGVEEAVLLLVGRLKVG